LKTLITPLVIAVCLSACKQKQPVVHAPLDPYIKKAESFPHQQSDSAYYYYNKVVTESTDSLQIAMAYNSMSALQSDAGDYFGSQENLLLSLRYLDEQDPDDRYCLSSDYNELGTTSLNLKNYDAAISYYDLALKYAEDEGYKLIFLNNKALVYQKKKNYSRAITIYDSIIDNSKLDKKAYARIVSNRARTRWLQDSTYAAAPELQKALNIRIGEEDDWGKNASYAHLADYYLRRRPDSALIYANKMYAIAKYLDSPDDQVEALQKLMLLTPAKAYFAIYQSLTDSLQTSRSTARNQFALIRYDAEKNKVENLKLQKENADKKVQIVTQYAVITITILAMFGIGFWYRKRKQQIALISENRIREHKLKTSQKIHDVVANGLYRIMTEVEHLDIDKEKLLDNIEALYNQSRDLSYEPPVIHDEEYHIRIASLLNSFNTDTIRVQVTGNEKDLWENLNSTAKRDLEYILQEIMVNMKKHSKASDVTINFRQSGNQIDIYYTDNGIGISPQQNFGNGLTNTGNRIRNLNGNIIFDPKTEIGLKIQISFPII